jgi:hypothetical protein
MSWSDAAPLAGIKVLNLCRVVSGPFATMQLGDLGAVVVKIEEPEHGDESRRKRRPGRGKVRPVYRSRQTVTIYSGERISRIARPHDNRPRGYYYQLSSPYWRSDFETGHPKWTEG